MARLTLQSKMIGLGAIAALAMAACGSKDGDGPGGSGGSGLGTGGGVLATGGGTAVATGGGTSSGGTNATIGECVVAVGEALIDDFEEADEAMPSANIPDNDGRSGGWYVDNDGSPMISSSSGQGQTPAKMMEYPTKGAGYNGSWGFVSEAAWGAADAADTTAPTYSNYGASFGVYLNNVGGTNECFDASGYDGITFWIKSNLEGKMGGSAGTPALDGVDQSKFKVSIMMPAVIPVASGGTCTLGDKCWDAHYTTIPTITKDWQQVTLPWSSFKQDGYSGAPVTFDPGEIVQITFGVGKDPGWYSVVLDDLSFYGGSFNVGGANGI